MCLKCNLFSTVHQNHRLTLIVFRFLVWTQLFLLEPTLEPGLHSPTPCSRAGSLSSRPVLLAFRVWNQVCGRVRWGLGTRVGRQEETVGTGYSLLVSPCMPVFFQKSRTSSPRITGMGFWGRVCWDSVNGEGWWRDRAFSLFLSPSLEFLSWW